MKPSLREKRSNLGICLIFFLVVVLCGCATISKQKPNIKDKSDAMFQEMEGKSPSNPPFTKGDISQGEKGLESVGQASRLSDKDVTETFRSPNLQQEEISFEEIGEGFASKHEKPIDAENRAEQDALSKALKKAGTDVYYGFSDTLAQSGKTQHQFVYTYILLCI